MNQQEAISYYQIGGSLANNSPSYVVRKADLELEKALEAGEFCYVLNSRQMGKSSLRVRAMSNLQAKGIICIFVDLTGMGTQNLSPEKWYLGIIYSLIKGCQIQFDWRGWWRENKDFLTPVQLLGLFIEEVLLVEIKSQIVIFVDEIDRVLSHNFSLDNFLAFIHSCYQKRQVNFDYQRLTFTLLGVAAPKDLIRDRNQSPFDMGKAINLEGFTLEECNPLILGLNQHFTNPEEILEDILAWTKGQPFLTQKLCLLALEKGRQNHQLTIADIVRQYIIHEWETQDEPEHLKNIRDRLFCHNSEGTIRLLSLYRDILQGSRITVSNTSEQIELRLSGLVVARRGILDVSNPIYSRIFDFAWLEKQLQQLRPYNLKLQKWLTSNCQDSSCLLTGEALQNTLIWSLGKSLDDLDYQFLVASQSLDKTAIENELKSIETASKLLAYSRKKARQKAEQKQLSKKFSLLLSLLVTVSILLLRSLGIWQAWEWNLLDRFFRWRLNHNIEPYIVVVTINEQDIKNIGKIPIPDRVFAQVISNLLVLKPNAIALDIYRDFPIASGNQKLLHLMHNTPNLYMLEKVIGNSIAPPPNITKERVGFADQVLDSDGKVRRALLSLTTKDRQMHFSLGTKLALHYLQNKQIRLESLKNNRYRLGKAIFARFTRNSGGYVRADAGGYQILLNYWGTEKNFRQYSLTEVLNNQIKSQEVRDKLVFIGSTAESIRDAFYTPYSKGWFRSPQKMSRIFIHANTASQIINAAMNNRPLLHTYNQLIESIWIFAWGTAGIFIGWQISSLYAIITTLLFTILILLLFCYRAFTLGLWLPLLPALLSLTLAVMMITLIKNRQRDRLIFNYTLKFLIERSKTNPIVARIALEYFKRSENKNNSLIIEQTIKNSQ